MCVGPNLTNGRSHATPLSHCAPPMWRAVPRVRGGGLNQALNNGFPCANVGGFACPCLPRVSYAKAELVTKLLPEDRYEKSGSSGT